MLDRLHEADVALLHEVEQVPKRALVLAGDHHDEPEVAGHEPIRGLDVVLGPVADRELVLLLASEERVAADLLQIALQGIVGDERAGLLLLLFLVLARLRGLGLELSRLGLLVEHDLGGDLALVLRLDAGRRARRERSSRASP